MKQASTESTDEDASLLGVLGQQEYQQFETQLESGDMVLGYSNVLTECRRANGQILGVNGLLQQLEQIDASRPSKIVSTLIARIEGANADNLEGHDATLLLCRATERSVGWKNNLLAPFRLFRSVADKTQLD